MTIPYRRAHEDMDATPRRPGDHHHGQVRPTVWDGGEQRAPEVLGLPGRVAQRPPRHDGFWGTGDSPVGAGGCVLLARRAFLLDAGVVPHRLH